MAPPLVDTRGALTVLERQVSRPFYRPGSDPRTTASPAAQRRSRRASGPFATQGNMGAIRIDFGGHKLRAHRRARRYVQQGGITDAEGLEGECVQRPGVRPGLGPTRDDGRLYSRVRLVRGGL